MIGLEKNDVPARQDLRCLQSICANVPVYNHNRSCQKQTRRLRSIWASSRIHRTVTRSIPTHASEKVCCRDVLRVLRLQALTLGVNITILASDYGGLAPSETCAACTGAARISSKASCVFPTASSESAHAQETCSQFQGYSEVRADSKI